MEITDKTLQKVIDIIVSLVAPDQIVLFGSYARGEQTENSDIDLLILKRGMRNSRDISYKIRRAFFDNKVRKSVDVLTYDYDEYNDVKDDIGYIYHTIQEEGVVIYGNI